MSDVRHCRHLHGIASDLTDAFLKMPKTNQNLLMEHDAGVKVVFIGAKKMFVCEACWEGDGQWA